MDVDTPPYLLVIFKEVSRLFDYDEFLSNSSGEAIDQDRLVYFHVETSLFLANAEEWLFIAASLLLAYLVISVVGKWVAV
jgi:hypothetical protein